MAFRYLLLSFKKKTAPNARSLSRYCFSFRSRLTKEYRLNPVFLRRSIQRPPHL